ncbi:MAG: TonB C-terminal domain-containing protein [Candidatus Omnitrophica bacterium]|nr:TonB C-terminal domain-containing protein [Candidatus Omnitrophota bacterium]
MGPIVHPMAPSADRLLFRAVIASLIGHALILGALVATSRHGALSEMLPEPVTSAKLVYQPQAPSTDRMQWRPEPSRSTERLGQLPAPALGPAAGAFAGGPGSLAAGGGAATGDLSRVAVGGSGASWSAPALSSGAGSAAIDLTNLTAAAQGDPVRFAYFSAIRERVQRTADVQHWETTAAKGGGVVYVEFAVDRAGQVHAVSWLQGRSQAPASLCDTAVRLVTTSTPFPPFPPSFEESSLTLLLPIEFMATGSS